jgi:hypothetical protein
MKLVLFALFFWLAGNTLFAQGKLFDIMPMDSGKVVYKKSVSEDCLSKEEIVKRIKAWADYHYKPGEAKNNC